MTGTQISEVAEPSKAVEKIRPVIERNRDAGERDKRLPSEVVEAMLDAGLLRQWAPRELGGEERDLRSLVDTAEAIARIDPSAGWLFANMAAGTMQLPFLPPEARREVASDPRGFAMAGSVASLGRAVPDGDGYRLSGQWRLASGCHLTEWLGGAALIFDGDAPRMGPDGAPDVKLMIFRREESEILDTWDPLGMRGTGSTDFRLDNVFVPGYRMFTLMTDQPLIGGPVYKAGVLVPFSLALAAVLPGIAQAAIDAFIEMARDKVPTMSQTTLGSRPTVHADVARAQMLVQAAGAYLREAAEDLQRSLEAGPGVTPDLEAKRRLACVNAGLASTEAVEMVFTLGGTSPIKAGHPLERCMRDIRTAAQHFLVSPAWLEKTGQYYFGHGLAMP